MKLYNTLTRQVETIVPLRAPAVTVYTCGPTVYDYAHIGHWFNYVRMDTLVRTLRVSGYTPQWVMNITDVGHLVSDADDGEDKLEKGARREGRTAWQVAEHYTRDFLECMQLLRIRTPDHITKATEHIPEQINLIKVLEEKGYTYTISDGVYFDTGRFEGYEAFARLDLDGLQAGARVSENREKRNPTDFALWKFSPPATEDSGQKRRDMEWESPWGIGFPGWHIECSAMSMKYLGETLDVHAGGIDHIPVHHTNEIAQSEAATGKRFANYWMHSNHVMAEGEKISKSLGNGIRLQVLMEKAIPAGAIRLYILESHYRSQSQFSMDGLEAAHTRYKGYQALADLRFQDISQEPAPGYEQLLTELADKVQAALQNDLNTAQALATISEAEAVLYAGYGRAARAGLAQMFDRLDDMLGIDFLASQDITTEQKQAVSERETVRKSQDYQRSDELRDDLLSQGIGLRDDARGTIWFRV